MSNAPVSPPDSSARLSRLSAIDAALRELDPDAQVALDPDSGRMKVLTVLPAADVVRVLQVLGETAELAGADAGAKSGGCGCGCGCSRL